MSGANLSDHCHPVGMVILMLVGSLSSAKAGLDQVLTMVEHVQIPYQEIQLIGPDVFHYHRLRVLYGTQVMKVDKESGTQKLDSNVLHVWLVDTIGAIDRECALIGTVSSQTKMHHNSLVISIGTTEENLLPQILPCLERSLTIDSAVFLMSRLKNDSLLFIEAYKASPRRSLILTELASMEHYSNESDSSSLNHINHRADLGLTFRWMAERYVWKRRSNLEGVNFTSITSFWAPFIQTIEKSGPNSTVVSQLDGLYNDVMVGLASNLNFNFSVAFEVDFTWNQMVLAIADGEFDFGLTGFSQTLARFLITDFSIPFSSTTVRILYPSNSDRSPLLIYVGSFLLEAWFGILMSLVTCFVCLTSLALALRSAKPDRELELSISSLAIFTLLSHLGRRVPQEPKSSSLRLAFFCISFGGFILISLYRAMLGASLAVKIHQPPIKSMEDLADSDHSVIISHGTSVYRYFATAPSPTGQFKLYQSKIRNHEPSGLSEDNAMAGLANGSISSSVLIGVYQPLSVLSFYPCQVRSLPLDFRTVGNGLVFKKHWPYTQLFNFYLLQMKEQGVFQQLKKKWSSVQDVSTCFPQEANTIEASIEHVFTLFGVWFCGIIVSVFVCTCEVFKVKILDTRLVERV